MEFKSEFYTSWPEYMQKNEIKFEEVPLMAPNIQMYEEMMFSFINMLLM